jgi:Rieske Fe-S protein
MGISDDITPGTLIAVRSAMDTPKTSRREFCAHAISLVTVTSLIEGCGGGGGNPNTPGGGGNNAPSLPTITATPVPGGVTVSVQGTALATSGNAALVRGGSQPLLVSRSGDTFTAVTAICTHEGCEITGFQSSSFVCPCHGSQYSRSGDVQAGPATQSLREFNTQFTNNVLTITL